MKQQQPSRALPISRYRREVLWLVHRHATVVVVGETGCGKTTQIPQYLADVGHTVACTQPREIAAESAAERVAEERGAKIGEDVGCAIRFRDVSGPRTRIKYLTDAALLREAMTDPLMGRYTAIMLDEAHERTLATDVLFGLLKKVQRRRPELRIVVASATIDAERVRQFFAPPAPQPDAAPADPDQGVSPEPAILSVEGMLHDVEVHYAREAVGDFVAGAVAAASQIHEGDAPGDVLVFLPRREDVERAMGLLEQHDAAEGSAGGLLPVALHEDMAPSRQRAALRPAPRGCRKVVVSTGIAETALTVDGVGFVVDACFDTWQAYDATRGTESRITAPASRASANQRAGRAGRTRPGCCLRLCTRAAFENLLPDFSTPAMQRSELSGVVLQLKALGVDNIMSFDWVAPPSPPAMVRALELLHALGALDRRARLTQPTGLHMAEFPIHPTLAKSLLASSELGCMSDMLGVAAMMDVMDEGEGRGRGGGGVGGLWQPGMGQRRRERSRRRFAVAEGDPFALLNAFRGYEKGGARWCARHGLQEATLARAAACRRQLALVMRRLGRPGGGAGVGDAPDGGDAVTALRLALIRGLFPNAAVRAEEAGGPGADYRTIRGRHPIAIDPASVVHGMQPSCVVYRRATDGAMVGVMPVDVQELTDAAPFFYVQGGA